MEPQNTNQEIKLNVILCGPLRKTEKAQLQRVSDHIIKTLSGIQADTLLRYVPLLSITRRGELRCQGGHGPDVFLQGQLTCVICSLMVVLLNLKIGKIIQMVDAVL